MLLKKLKTHDINRIIKSLHDKMLQYDKIIIKIVKYYENTRYYTAISLDNNCFNTIKILERTLLIIIPSYFSYLVLVSVHCANQVTNL